MNPHLITLSFFTGLLSLALCFVRVLNNRKASWFDYALFILSLICPISWVVWVIVGVAKACDQLSWSR